MRSKAGGAHFAGDASAAPPDASGARPPDASGARPHGRRRPTPFNRYRRGLIPVVILVVLIPAAWSYGAALAAPGNDAFSVRSVEWLRDHHLRWLVNDVENFWYTHHQPRKGGAPTGKLGAVIRSGPPPVPRTGGPASPPAVTHLPAPTAVQPFVAQPLPGEGQWRPLGQPVHGVPAMYAAYLRPDPVHTSLVTGLAWMDPTLVRMDLYAGVQEPGGSDWRYRAPMALADRTNLLAAFNSGFKLKDSGGGYYAQGRVVRPLRAGAATLVINANGTPTVGEWGRDLVMGPDVAFARQNLSLIVDGGRPVADISSSNAKWGATVGQKVLVWRSGVGVTAEGALIYAGGNGLSAASLAAVLTRAGAVRAMELDINSAWVDFFTYAAALPGRPPGDVTGIKLVPDMAGSNSRYLGDNSRDFVAVFRRD